jgi:hypothetical protein
MRQHAGGSPCDNGTGGIEEFEPIPAHAERSKPCWVPADLTLGNHAVGVIDGPPAHRLLRRRLESDGFAGEKDIARMIRHRGRNLARNPVGIAPHLLSGRPCDENGEGRAQTEKEGSSIFHISLSGNKMYSLA